MTCNVKFSSIASVIVVWEPLGEIAGFAEGDNVIEITPNDDNDNVLDVSSDGRFGGIYGSAKTDGEVMVRLHQSSPYASLIRTLYRRNRFATGRMTITNADTGETHVLNCVTLKNNPSTSIGTEDNGGDEFMWTYLSQDYIAPVDQLDFIAQNAIAALA